MKVSIAALALSLCVTSALARPTVGVEADLQDEANALSVKGSAPTRAPVFASPSVEENDEDENVDDYADADAAAAVESMYYDWKAVAGPDQYKQHQSSRDLENARKVEVRDLTVALGGLARGTAVWKDAQVALLRGESRELYASAATRAVSLSRSRASQTAWMAMDQERNDIGLTSLDPEQLMELDQDSARFWLAFAIERTRYTSKMREIEILENEIAIEQLLDIPEAHRTTEDETNLNTRASTNIRLKDEIQASKYMYMFPNTSKMSRDAHKLFVEAMKLRLPATDAALADILQSPEALL